MTIDEKQKVLIALMQVNMRNRDNRITEDLANGISVGMGEFLDTLVIVEKPTQAQNVEEPEQPKE